MLSQPVLILVILLTAVGFIIVMAVMIFCSFRARTNERRKNYPVFVIPSPGQENRVSLRKGFGSSLERETSNNSQNEMENIELKRYRILHNTPMDGDFDQIEISPSENSDEGGVVNPVFDPGPSTSAAAYSPLQNKSSQKLHTNLASDPYRIVTDNNMIQKPMCLEIGQNDNSSALGRDSLTSVSTFPGTKKVVSNESQPNSSRFLPRFPNDVRAIQLERESQRRTQQMRQSEASVRALSTRITNNNNNEYPNKGKSLELRKADKESSMSSPVMRSNGNLVPSGSWSPEGAEGGWMESVSSPVDLLPTIQSNYKLRRELAEAIASDRVAESSVMFDGISNSVVDETSLWNLSNGANGLSAENLSTGSQTMINNSSGLTVPSSLTLDTRLRNLPGPRRTPGFGEDGDISEEGSVHSSASRLSRPLPEEGVGSIGFLPYSPTGSLKKANGRSSGSLSGGGSSQVEVIFKQRTAV